MSKSVRVSKLESLLARIRGRAAEPRPAAPNLAGAPVLAPVPPTAAVAAAPPATMARTSEVPVEAPVEEPTIPPPPADADFAVDVDVPFATTPPPPPLVSAAPPPVPAADAPVQAREAEAREPLQSRERLAAGSTSAPPSSAPDADEAGAPPSLSHSEVLADEESLVGEGAGEMEEAPASSRRPVAPAPEERLAELAFGAGEPQPPRHTPPPKSGRLPAAPASEFDADVTGVREAVTPPSHEDDVTQPPAKTGAASALVAQVTRPQFVAEANVRVTDVIGDAQKFAPKTFLALLDASLSL